MLPGEKMNFRLNIRNAGFWNSGPGCLHYGAKSNDDSDGKENGKKVTGLDKQNNTFARAPCLFVHVFAVTARL